MKIFFLSGIFLARPPRLSHHADQVKRPEQLPSNITGIGPLAREMQARNEPNIWRDGGQVFGGSLCGKLLFKQVTVGPTPFKIE